MLNINTVKQHIDAGHEFYWDVLPFTHRYQLRAVTYTWLNGSMRSKLIYTADDYETAKLVNQTMINSLHAKLDLSNFNAIHEQRYWLTGSEAL